MLTTDALEQAQLENRVLSRIIEVLFSDGDLEEVLVATTDLILEATGADVCFLHRLDDRREKLVLSAASEPYRDAVGKVQLKLGEGVAGWVAQNRKSVVIPDNKFGDPRYKYIPELGGARYRSMVSVPLISPVGSLVGVVNIHTEQERDFQDREVAFLEHVGSMVAAAVEHATLFQELAIKEQACQRVVERTVEAQEDERRRVATEIHDGVTQHLISIYYRLNACESQLDRDTGRAREELAVARELIDAALDEARSAIYDLRPSTLDDLGLVPALEQLASRTLGSEISVAIAADLHEPLPGHLETALYRIAQEALNNVRKHSEAGRVEVTVETEDDGFVLLRVIDDGRGFDLEGYRRARPDASFGLMGMSERVDLVAGELRIESAVGKGTRIEVHVPVVRPDRGGA